MTNRMTNSDVVYNDKLNYKLLNNNLLRFTRFLGSFIIDIKSFKIIKYQVMYNFLTFVIIMFHIYVTPDVFISLKYKMEEFNYKNTTFHNVMRVIFPILVDMIAMLSKITVYRMTIFLNSFYNYLFLSDMYINLNKSMANDHNKRLKRDKDTLTHGAREKDVRILRY